jgi:light-regulated signal transduction histidine kinase (bacteriophytochrome)
MWDISSLEDMTASRRAFEELQRTGYVRYEDLPLETHDGSKIAVEFVSNVYLVDDARVAQCNIRSITERKRTESEIRALNSDLEQRVRDRTSELEALNRELETFNYAVSHDLRAPLRRIMGFTNVLEEDQVDKQTDANLQTIRSIRVSVDRMNDLISALLELARFSRERIKRQSVDLSAMVHAIAAELQNHPDRQVEFTIADGVLVQGDEQFLRIVLENLLGNAWKFTAHCTVAHIAFGIEPQSDGSRAYFVRDDGAGFDMAYADNLFGAFQRLHSEKSFPGIGIGLATVQRIIHRHNGRVWAKSRVNEGATFYFTVSGTEKFAQLAV